MTNSDRFSRRRFMTTAAKGLALIPVASMFQQGAWAADVKPIPADHPTAMALGYYADAAAVDTAKYPKRGTPEGATQLCDNCMHYKPIDDATGTCALLPGFSVAAKGWCNVWVAKP